ncbi:MAG: DUF1570 domain-containing protein [Planctomycetota bacterium]|nr:DUF1570 domain-containing protein [Planctomycetota bacterium]
MDTLRPLRLAAVTLLLLAAGSARADEAVVPPVAVAAEGAHFRILCHFDNEAVAREALVLAEAAWRPTTAVVGFEPKLEGKIDIHLYRTPEVYRAAEGEITNGTFARNNAFSSWALKTAHIALEPVYSDALLKRVGLTAQTKRNIAHEAAHLIVYYAWRHFRQHPRWLSEGIAIWAADEALVPGGTPKALGTRPFASRRIVRFRALADEDRLPPLDNVVAWDRYRDLGFHDRYAFWWGFFRHLYTGPRREAFQGVLKQIADMPAGGAFTGALRTAMKQALADEDGSFDTLRAELTAFGSQVDGRWDEVIRTMDMRGRTWWQLAFPDSNAICWRNESAGEKPYGILGVFEIQPTDEPQVNVLLGRDEEQGFISVAYRVGSGVSVFRYDAAEDTWTRLAYEDAPSLATAKRHGFLVAVEAGTVTAWLDRQRIVSVDIEDHPLEGAWGLGVQAGGAGVWSNVRLRR